MKVYTVDKSIFKFQYLPEYADFILKNKLEEFVTVGIRFCREVDLPLLKPLAKLSEKELVSLSIESNRQILSSLASNRVGDLIETNVNNWVKNKIDIIDKNQVVAEDLTLVYFIRRKLFSYFLDSYTKNLVEQKFIIGEVDVYTTQEELISYNAYFQIQKENAEI